MLPELLVDNYARRTRPTLEGWRRNGLPLALELEEELGEGALNTPDRS